MGIFDWGIGLIKKLTNDGIRQARFSRKGWLLLPYVRLELDNFTQHGWLISFSGLSCGLDLIRIGYQRLGYSLADDFVNASQRFDTPFPSGSSRACFASTRVSVWFREWIRHGVLPPLRQSYPLIICFCG
ncbi:hypothetical protein [Pseudomonas sp. NPDC086251]|uniref:hypothetical protein n=1 Tax=Pseudomonas sp. NPDC086251 TaxID=3364431 RepID=UPI0038385045